MALRTELVLGAVAAERERQQKLWNRSHEWGYGDCSSEGVAPSVKLAVLGEEYGEVAQALLERDRYKLREELVQLAAVAVAWVENIDGKGA